MKLISLKLNNFRQFYGKTPEIILANGDNNTTIIHGNNGSGKTTLLNAFTWVLYEKFTAAFTSPELLVNKRAITEVNYNVSVECLVEIRFEHDNKYYHLKRQCFAYKDLEDTIQYGKSNLFMLISRDDGAWYPPSEPAEDIIQRILPESLHRYFFFDGEHIDHIFRHKNTNIAEDTKELIGIKLLDRSVEHLKKARKTLQEELKAIGDVETKKLLQEQLKLEKENERLQEKQEEIIKEIESYQVINNNISQRLSELAGAKGLQESKIQLEAQEKLIRNNLIESKKRIKKAISSQGYLILLPEVITLFNQMIDNLREKGELPTGIKQQFVEQLLKRQRCICGMELKEDTEHYHHVQAWMNKAGVADVEEAAIRLETQVQTFEKQVTDFWQEIDRCQANINENRTLMADVENRLDDIKEKLRNYDDEEIKKLQIKLDDCEKAIKELILEQGGNKQIRENFVKKIEEINKQVSKNQLKESKQILAQRRIQVTEEAITRLIEVKTRLENQFRLALEKQVQKIFNSISFTPYIPRLKENYELVLVENTSGIARHVAASTGENQILSLSFIGAIIDRVREWSQKNNLIGIDSSTFPIVMDSAFGSLDEIYRRQVAKAIPQLANQLVVLVTKTQWRGEVEEEMANYIGKEYVLVYNSPKADCEEDGINLGGVFYPLVKPSPNNFEYTEIIEVDRNK